MKSHNDLFNNLCSLENLKIAFRKSKKGKTKKWYMKKFEKGLDNKLLQLKYELQTQSYSPKPLKRFIIRDPKTRVIHASAFRDRIVHHAICNIIEPIFEKIFIYDSYASRQGKGPLSAVKRFENFQRKISINGKLIKNAKNNNMIIGYVLKADIKHYFPSVNHDILIKILKRKIRDRNVILLIRKILDTNSNYSGKGMPIGNMTSQFFANVYLNELDYFVKHKLKAKYYIRYVDDFVILDRNKENLIQIRNKIKKYLNKNLKIELHDDKSHIHPLFKGINFLGFRIFYYYKLLSKKNIREIKNRMKRLRNMCFNDEIHFRQLDRSLQGWEAYAIWADTYRLRRRIRRDFIPTSKHI